MYAVARRGRTGACMIGRMLVVGLVLLAACEQEPADSIVETNAEVQFVDVEGGVWVLRAFKGTFDPSNAGERYNPRNLPEQYQLVGARLTVRLRILRDVATTDMVGTPVEILQAEPWACGATCGMPGPPITLWVTGPDPAVGIEGVALENLEGPPPRAGFDAVSSRCWSIASPSGCEIWGPAPGAYSFDLTGAGHQPRRLDVVVPEVIILPGACCPLGWKPQILDVTMTPN